ETLNAAGCGAGAILWDAGRARHCERSEAIHCPSAEAMDCFVAPAPRIDKTHLLFHVKRQAVAFADFRRASRRR
ncbi:hypothetical protein NQ228_25350, partial [Escherichia coli]|nr:hypothetical protein [Escherichia coli]